MEVINMGAVLFELEVKGNDVGKEFEQLQREAIYEYGNDPYNGTISTTSLDKEIRLTDSIKEMFKKKNYDELDRIFYPEKRCTQYTKEVDHFKRYAPKWENGRETVKRQKGVTTIKKYGLKSDIYLGGHSYKKYNTITEAKKAAKQLSIELGADITIVQYRSNGDTFSLGKMELQTDGKEFRTKRTVKSAVYLPTYKIKFYVYAAE